MKAFAPFGPLVLLVAGPLVVAVGSPTIGWALYLLGLLWAGCGLTVLVILNLLIELGKTRE